MCERVQVFKSSLFSVTTLSSLPKTRDPKKGNSRQDLSLEVSGFCSQDLESVLLVAGTPRLLATPRSSRRSCSLVSCTPRACSPWPVGDGRLGSAGQGSVSTCAIQQPPSSSSELLAAFLARTREREPGPALPGSSWGTGLLLAA